MNSLKGFHNGHNYFQLLGGEVQRVSHKYLIRFCKMIIYFISSISERKAVKK